ncbi:MAG TPA: hypothetical protein ENN46_00715 [Candidatus Woesearchaeota archaeon]|nr:hypothetical protein [Candidatus Woesearchaeota archaeon]
MAELYYDYYDKSIKFIEEEFKKEGAHIVEVERGVFSKSNYPSTSRFQRLAFQSYNLPMEEPYYFLVKLLKTDFSFDKMIKIIDSFAASESSSFFGSNAQRLGIQQDKASQFMATVGKMVKELFQILRELRILDERLSLYDKSYGGEETSEVTLKGTWIDLVEGGAKNPASVWGMANELGFSLLPDLFFSVNLKNADEVEGEIKRLKEKGDFSTQLVNVLARKLKAYYAWKDHTFKELKTRRKFTIKYLKQYYDAINLYISWIKPYLDNIRGLHMNNKLKGHVEVVSGFESSMMEMEFLATKSNAKTFKPIIIVNFSYRTRPNMNFSNEYNRGPTHVGRAEFTMRGYVWNDEQIEKFLKVRRKEQLEMVGSYDASVKEVLESLGDDLSKYLAEFEEEKNKDNKKDEERKEKPKGKGMFEPILSVFSGMKEIFGPLFPETDKPIHKSLIDTFTQKETMEKFQNENEIKKAFGTVDVAICKSYEVFKKAHGMLAW